MKTPRRLAVVMDPIAEIKHAKDSTLAMLIAAQARSFELFYLEQRDLRLRDGKASARVRPLTVRADPASWHTLGEPRSAALGEFDCILMRKDPPFDIEYVYSTYILERAQDQGALVVNAPRGLRDMNEKVYTAWFPECCAPTLITRDMGDMDAFLRTQGKIVVKPLDGMGGRSIFVVEHDDKNRHVIFETLSDYGRRFIIVQRYLPEIVASGDTVATRWICNGSQVKEFQGVPANGQTFSVEGMNFYRLKNGRVTEIWTQFDNTGMMEQLRAVPA